MEEIVNAVLCKLKTGVQCYQLPVKALFDNNPLNWQSIYYHYWKWCMTDVLKKSWTSILEKNKSKFDLSSVDFDDSYTSAIRGGEAFEYKGRKKTENN